MPKKKSEPIKEPLENGFKKRWKVALAGLIFLVVLALGIGIWHYSSGNIAGEAFYTEEITPSSGDNTFWIDFKTATAAKGDYVPMTIKFKTDPGNGKVSGAGFKIDYDKTMFTIEPSQMSGKLPVAGAGFSWAGEPKDIASFVDQGKAIGLFGPGVGGEAALATLYFKVIGEYPGSSKEYSFKVMMEVFDTNDVQTKEAKPINLVSKEFVSKVEIVPPCSDADADGFGKEGTNLKGCGGKSGYDKGAQKRADCNDNPNQFGKSMYPFNSEICDGLDNDCNNIIDDVPKTANDKIAGVCSGYKLCLPKDLSAGWDKHDPIGWELKNSYEIDSSLFENGKIAKGLAVQFKTPLELAGVYQSAAYSADEGKSGDKCDYLDNDCDNEVDEGMNCVMGGSGGGEGLIGNVYLTWKNGKYEEGMQTVDVEDLNALFILKDLYGPYYGSNFPVCSIKDEGYLCYCANGDHYIINKDKVVQSVKNGKKSKEKAEGYQVITENNGNIVLINEKGDLVACK
jgi:hypothetical protein